MTKRKNRWNRNVTTGESPAGFSLNAYTGGVSVLANMYYTALALYTHIPT
jgi:hypothetical protein